MGQCSRMQLVLKYKVKIRNYVTHNVIKPSVRGRWLCYRSIIKYSHESTCQCIKCSFRKAGDDSK